MNTVTKCKKLRSNLQPYRKPQVPGRNDPCPCGSGKKAKRCCLNNIKVLAALPPQVRTQFMVDHIFRQPIRETPPIVTDTGRTIHFTSGAITTEDGIQIPVESGEIIVSNTHPEATA